MSNQRGRETEKGGRQVCSCAKFRRKRRSGTLKGGRTSPQACHLSDDVRRRHALSTRYVEVSHQPHEMVGDAVSKYSPAFQMSAEFSRCAAEARNAEHDDIGFSSCGVESNAGDCGY